MSDKLKLTTENILEQLKNTPLTNISVSIGNNQYLISLPMMKALAWAAIPDMIKDENSEMAKMPRYQLLRTGLKTIIRPWLPEILKMTWGEPVAITPRLNILTWLSSYFVHLILNAVAYKKWVVHVEDCESCGENVFKVVGITTSPDVDAPAPALPQPTDNPESI